MWQLLRLEKLVDEKTYIKLSILIKKINTCRKIAFTEGGMKVLDFEEIVRKYMSLRLNEIKHDKLFFKYTQEKC